MGDPKLMFGSREWTEARDFLSVRITVSQNADMLVDCLADLTAKACRYFVKFSVLFCRRSDEISRPFREPIAVQRDLCCEPCNVDEETLRQRSRDGHWSCC